MAKASNVASVGDCSGWRGVVSGSRHPIQDLEPGHVSGVCPGPERVDQNDGTERFDSHLSQKVCQRDSDRQAETGRISWSKTSLAPLQTFLQHHFHLMCVPSCSPQMDINEMTQPWGLEVDRVELTLGALLKAPQDGPAGPLVVPPSVPGLEGITGPIQQLAMQFLGYSGSSQPQHGMRAFSVDFPDTAHANVKLKPFLNRDQRHNHR